MNCAIVAAKQYATRPTPPPFFSLSCYHRIIYYYALHLSGNVRESHPFLLRNFLIFSLRTPFLLYQKLQILKFSFFWSSILDKVQHFVSHRNVRKTPFPSRQKSSKFHIEFQKIHFSKLRRLHK